MNLRKKSYKSIVAPLVKMAGDLKDYADSQKTVILDLVEKKTKIESDMESSQLEITRSQYTSEKISELLASDGVDDYEEDPEQDETKPEITE